MSARHSAETLLPRERPSRTRVSGLPPDLLAQSARRLRILALQYAFVFFMSDPLLAILFPEDRAVFLSSALRWAPATLSITTALLVAGLDVQSTHRGRHRPRHGSGLRSGRKLRHRRRTISRSQPVRGWTTVARPSWVAVWMIGFTVVVPSQPRQGARGGVGVGHIGPAGRRLCDGTPISLRSDSAGAVLLHLVVPYLLVVSSPTSARGLCTAWAPTSSALKIWAATAWSSVWARAAWARSGGPGTGCWPGRQPIKLMRP